MRDLPREDLPDDWRAEARNLDRAWFQREELPGLLPPNPGRRRSEGPVEPALVQRLARLHLVDNVRGQAPLFRPERVVEAELTVRVVRTRRGRAHLEYTGRARLEEEGRWAVEHPGRRKVEADRRRGYAAALRGEAVWNLDEQRFVSFELVAAGPRWGATQFNGRYDDEGPRGWASCSPSLPRGIASPLPTTGPIPRCAPQGSPADHPRNRARLHARSHWTPVSAKAALRGLQAVAVVTATYGGAHLASRLDLLCGT